MASYNIFAHNNGQDDVPVLATVVLNDNDSAVVDVVSDDPEVQAEALSVISDYIAAGFSALDAVSRYAGSYGDVQVADGEGAPETAPEEDLAAEALVSATEATDEYAIPDGTMAMTNDDGVVITLLQRDPEHGAVLRHDGAWVPVTDPSTLDDLNFVGVEEDAIDLYDSHEAEGNLATIGSFTPSTDGPFWPEVLVEDQLVLDEETGEYSSPDEVESDGEEPGVNDEPEEEDEDDEALTASVTLDGADELPDAIAAALRDPELRWYVERRVAALGLEADLPWQES